MSFVMDLPEADILDETNEHEQYEYTDSETEEDSGEVNGRDTAPDYDGPGSSLDGFDNAFDVKPEGDWYDGSNDNWKEYREVLPTLSFSDPLPPPADTLEINGVKIDGQRHAFLSSFLHQRRYTDIPFGTAHRLLNYIMHLSEEAAFEFLKLRAPERLWVEYRWRKSADELEIQKWVRHLRDLQYTSIREHLAGEAFPYDDLNGLRLHAVHSWVYDTDQIRAAVGFIALLKDEGRLTSLEEVLKILHSAHQVSGNHTITDAEKRITDLALGIVPTTITTVHQTLCRVQELLESACYNFWVKHNPERLTEMEWHFSDTANRNRLPPGSTGRGWDCPERVELNLWQNTVNLRWDFPDMFAPRDQDSEEEVADAEYIQELLRSACELRNVTAHRKFREDGLTLVKMLNDAWCLATELEDWAAADEINVLEVKECLFRVYDEQAEIAEWRRLSREQQQQEERAKIQQQILEDTMLLHPYVLQVSTSD